MKLIDGFRRRSRIDHMVPAELAIRNAVRVVEGVGAHPLLTEAVVLLSEAQEKVADFVELVNEMNAHAHTCHCGTAKRTPHEIGTWGCIRSMVEAPTPAGPEKWMVDGVEITDYTLRQQRGYSQHPCGCWSRWPGSSNSINA